jgi:hypothetical protein
LQQDACPEHLLQMPLLVKHQTRKPYAPKLCSLTCCPGAAVATSGWHKPKLGREGACLPKQHYQQYHPTTKYTSAVYYVTLMCENVPAALLP